MKRFARRLFAISILILLLQSYAAADTSALWGERGERWSPQSRLPDFSFAGYRCGEAPIPRVAVAASVKDFGARGDGVTDDTAAFQKAVNGTPRGALLVPPGRYVLTSVVKIAHGNLVLRGSGPDKTVLVIPKSLAQIVGPSIRADNKSSYSFSGGFLAVAGAIEGQKLADVTAPAKRGDRQLSLSTAAGIAPGAFVQLMLRDANHSLGRYLHADQADAGVDTYKSLENKPWVAWAVRIASVSGRRVTLERPLRLDVRPEWRPEIRSYRPTVTEVGIEDLAFEFPGVPKKAHLQEEGFNAIHITGAADCWVRNVAFTDADNGVIVGGSRFCTITNTHFKASKRTGLTGHHALWATGGSQDCLFTDFRFDTTYEHDLTVEGRANGNVFRNGSGVALNFDHHRNAPYENLFTNLNVGNPRRVWQSSGREDRGPHSGARATFWNLRAERGKFPQWPKWPQINIIGVPGYDKNTTPDRQWIEPIAAVEPPDLYEAQRSRRTKPGVATFRNPLKRDGADPWMTYYRGYYYLSTTTAVDVRLRRARRLSELPGAPDQVVWKDNTPGRSRDIWAAEFHRLDGGSGPRWYLYYTASDGRNDNSHRLFVAESAGDDPMGPYAFKAQLQTDPDDRHYAIDGTVLKMPDGALYFLWCGRPSPTGQGLYIARMANPWTLAGPRAYLDAEGFGCPHIREGPETLLRDGRVLLIYSMCGASTPDYRLGMLTADARSDLLNPASWRQHPQVLFARADQRGVFGPGHCFFFKSPDNKEDWIVYHAKSGIADTYADRSTRAQRFTWNSDGTPDFGLPLPLDADIPAPSGEPPPDR